MNRRLIVVAMVVVSFITMAFFARPTVVQASHGITAIVCNSDTHTATLTIHSYAGGLWSNTLYAGSTLVQFMFGSATIGSTFTVSVTSPLFVNGVSAYTTGASYGNASTTCRPGTGNVTSTHFDDGRLNFADAFETSAIYCLGDGSVRVRVPGTPFWYIAFTASPAEIAKVPKHPTTNTLIKSGLGARLYRLMSGELQVNSGHPNGSTSDYVFIFKDCALPAVQ